MILFFDEKRFNFDNFGEFRDNCHDFLKRAERIELHPYGGIGLLCSRQAFSDLGFRIWRLLAEIEILKCTVICFGISYWTLRR